MSEAFLTLLLMCHVPLGSSLHHSRFVSPLILWWRDSLSLQLLLAVAISPRILASLPQRGAPSYPWCLSWRPYKAIVYTGAHGSGLQLLQ